MYLYWHRFDDVDANLHWLGADFAISKSTLLKQPFFFQQVLVGSLDQIVVVGGCFLFERSHLVVELLSVAELLRIVNQQHVPYTMDVDFIDSLP